MGLSWYFSGPGEEGAILLVLPRGSAHQGLQLFGLSLGWKVKLFENVQPLVLV